MLQTIRENSQSIVAKVIVGLIVVTFALFGVESLVSLTAGSNAPATVNGEEIAERQLLLGVELQRRQLLSQMGENADPALLDDALISNMVLDGLIEQAVLTQAASGEGQVFSDRMIDQMLVNTPAFQVDGKFDRAQFEAMLRNAGFTPLTYRDALRKEKLIEQQRSAYLLSSFALENELDRVIKLDQQSRDLQYFVLSAPALKETLTVSDEAVKAYFEQHRSDYKTEEQVVIEYLVLDKAQMLDGIEVTDAELDSAYQAMLAGFKGEEERQASHILVEITTDRDQGAALERAQALAARIAAGEAFATVAQAESDDPGSASAGGDLGFNGRGVFVPEFEDALFALEEGTVSEPVLTEFGYHLIQLQAVQSTEAPSFAEVASELKQDLLRQKVEGVYVEQLERLADLTFSSGDLVEPSQALSLAIQQSAPFGRVGGEDDITTNARVISAAYSNELLKERLNSTPIELDSSRSVVLRVKQHLLPREQSLEEVAQQVEATLLEQQVTAALDAQQQEFEDALKAGASLSEVAADRALESREGVNRSSGDLPIEVRIAAFKAAKPDADKPAYTAAILADGSRAVIAVTAVNAGGSAELKPEELAAMQAILGSRSGQYHYADLVAGLKAKADIEKK